MKIYRFGDFPILDCNNNCGGTDELDEVYLKKVNTIIIAETGVTTGFYIKDVGFTNAVAARLQLTPLGITGQLNIIEPFGMSLYEKLVIAAQTLGVKNHLELSVKQISTVSL